LVDHPKSAEVAEQTETHDEKEEKEVMHQDRYEPDSEIQNEINDHGNKPSKEVRRSCKIWPFVLSSLRILRAGRRKFFHEVDPTVRTLLERGSIFGSASGAVHVPIQ
jgi:hypothetical protein